jgi:hypothetical protein
MGDSAEVPAAGLFVARRAEAWRSPRRSPWPQRAVDQDRKRLRKLIILFPAECTRMLTMIHEAVYRANAAGRRRSAYTRKGAVSNLGAVAAARTTRRLEELGRAGELAGVPQTLTLLEQQLQGFEAALVQLEREGSS